MNVLYIAAQTFKEIYQSKILVNILFLGFFLFLVTYVVSEFSYGVANKVTLDIGLGTLSLSGTAIALFLGATLIQKEIASRTLYMVISRPVSRTTFLIGKMMGLAGILLINIMLLFSILILFYFLLDGHYNYLIPWSLLYIYLESLLVMFIVVFFSLISNNIIAVLSTLTIFIAGHGIQSVRETSLYGNDHMLRGIVDFYSKVAPDFSRLNIKNFVLYEKFLETNLLFSSLIYASFWIALFLILSSLVISKKEFS